MTLGRTPLAVARNRPEYPVDLSCHVTLTARSHVISMTALGLALRKIRSDRLLKAVTLFIVQVASIRPTLHERRSRVKGKFSTKILVRGLDYRNSLVYCWWYSGSLERTPMSGRQRDSQKSKLYAAEQVLRTSEHCLGLTPEEVVKLVRKIEQSPYTIKKYGPRNRRIILDGNSRSWARGGYAYVDLSAQFARRTDVVIHEIAHGYAPGHGHDWHFCEVYLDLVRHFMGKYSADTLKASFKRHKVKFTQPRQRTGLRTPAQIAAAEAGRLRLAEARAKRQGASGRFGILVEDRYDRVLVKAFDRWGRISSTTHFPSRAREWKTQSGVTGALTKFNPQTRPGPVTALVVDLSWIEERTYSNLKVLDLDQAAVKF